MPTSLSIHGRSVENLFELLGSKEDDITKSIGWTLSRAPSFLAGFSEAIGAPADAFDQVCLQRFGEDKGFTDIELIGPHHHAIVEAKRGWWLPGDWQLEKYRPRLRQSGAVWTKLVAMSDCSSTYASTRLTKAIDGIGISYLAWRDIAGLAGRLGKTHAEKRLLRELSGYLSTVATMQDVTSNWVYVVSLGYGAAGSSDVSWIDVIEKHGIYFHPVGKRGFPKEPPNYVGFRYYGKLQSIHHVDSFRVCLDQHEAVAGLPVEWDWKNEPHYVYDLGPAIRPPHEVKPGPSVKRSARVWAALDLLLTSETITEAMARTKERVSGTGSLAVS